ncbi:hypothetical protein BT96DRAFT_155143 [Gymnopus androsaceus JB14]|uniref:Uncharacterized protein n=1 Tax=Gymnopus androsaceus JB14 TaxID=1447944 RepID=A0A6A4HC32_9AGAR|nr:hypothetical protein BT96DRAFT_155143 [Gymnopus androsaceus JB14]
MGGGVFSGSTRTLTSSTPTPYNDPRNGTATSTLTPYDSRSGATPTPYDSRSRSQLGGATPTPTPYDSHSNPFRNPRKQGHSEAPRAACASVTNLNRVRVREQQS